MQGNQSRQTTNSATSDETICSNVMNKKLQPQTLTGCEITYFELSEKKNIIGHFNAV